MENTGDTSSSILITDDRGAHQDSDTGRFFGQLGLGTGNYTEERRSLFADLTLEDYRQTLENMKAGSHAEKGTA